MANKQIKTTSFKGTGGLKAAVITADKPDKIKQKEKEEELKKQKDNEKKGFYGRTVGYSPIRRRTDGGIIRLKRRNA